MKKALYFAVGFLLVISSSCTKYEPVNTDFASLAEGVYKGSGMNGSEEFGEEWIQVTKIGENEIQIQSLSDDDNAKIPGFSLFIDKHGAAIHQILGTEDIDGTFTIDLSQAPNSIEFDRFNPQLQFNGNFIRN